MTTPATALNAVSLRSYLQVLRRQRRLIVVVIVLTVVFGTLPSVMEDARYTSATSIRVTPFFEQGIFETGDQQSLESSRARELGTEVEIIKSSSIRQLVNQRLPADAIDYESPTVQEVGFTDVITIRVVAHDPKVAAEVANTYAQVFIESRRDRAISALVTKVDELRTQSAEASSQFEAISARLAGEDVPANERATLQLQQSSLIDQIQTLNRRADELDVEASLREGGTQVLSAAGMNFRPISPRPLRSAVLAFTLGVFLSLGLAVVADTVQDRLGGEDDLDDVWPNAVVLASVPLCNMDALTSDDVGSFAAREAYRFLRTSVRFVGQDSNVRSLLVTSAIGGEGKTTTATNLAVTMAEAGDRVVLVDCDLRRPSLHTRFGISNDAGLTSLMVGDVSLQAATTFVRDNLAVVPAGPLIGNPTEVLSSRAFERVLRAIVEQADFTILDAPPVLPVADAIITGAIVDGVIVVGRIGSVRRRAVREALRRLSDAGIRVVGLVANAGPLRDSYRDYRAYTQHTAGEPSSAPDGPTAGDGTSKRSRRTSPRTRQRAAARGAGR